MKLAHLLKSWVSLDDECLITGLQNDSRQVKPGDLFLAYPGAAVDGRLFINNAVAAGATAVVYEPALLPKEMKLPEHIPCIPVPNLSVQLGLIAQRFYGNPGSALNITGVTGTNGKTTVAYQLAQAHSLLKQAAAYIGTIGQGPVEALSHLDNTTPDALCLQKLLYHYQQKQIKQVCMEVSSHALAQQRVAGIAFQQAIFTNLTLDHLDYHQTMENYAAAKALLFASPALKYAIINQDDEYKNIMSAALPASATQLTYGLSEKADVRAISWRMTIRGTELDVQSPWGAQTLLLQALGQFNIYNCLAIFTSLIAQGHSIGEIAEIMPQLKAAPGRLEIVSKSPYVLVDYAHTPDALQNALMTLNQIKKGRLWVIFGCGGDRDKSKRPIMGHIASQYADITLVTSDNPRTEEPQQIMDDIMQGVQDANKAMQFIDRKEAIHHALNHAAKEDVILIAGKGHEAYQQIGLVKYPFSDQEIVKQFLKRE